MVSLAISTFDRSVILFSGSYEARGHHRVLPEAYSGWVSVHTTHKAKCGRLIDFLGVSAALERF